MREGGVVMGCGPRGGEWAEVSGRKEKERKRRKDKI